MRNRIALIGSLIAASLSLFAVPARADLHTWHIGEVFSNADGSVQFIEMREVFGFNFQDKLATSIFFPHTFTTNANTFVYPHDLPNTLTANKRFLMATAGFGLLPGGVTPDYTIPSQFFSVSGDMLAFSTVLPTFDFVAGELPTDAVNSLLVGGVTAVNSPTNFAGDTDSVIVPIPGDGNLDGIVGAADYTTWANGFGMPNPVFTDGNYNLDDAVNAADYTTWANHFGMMAVAPSSAARALAEPVAPNSALAEPVAPDAVLAELVQPGAFLAEPVASAAVPEPSTFVLFMLAMVSLFGFRRRRCSRR